VPTLRPIGAFRIYFDSHEPNEPRHIHIDGGDATIKIWLESLNVARNRGCRAHEIKGVVEMVQANRDSFLEAWHGCFG
jgi:hypothetical protein